MSVVSLALDRGPKNVREKGKSRKQALWPRGGGKERNCTTPALYHIVGTKEKKPVVRLKGSKKKFPGSQSRSQKKEACTTRKGIRGKREEGVKGKKKDSL